MSDRLPRRSLFAVLASLPARVVGFFTGRPEAREASDALVAMCMRHSEEAHKMVLSGSAETARLLSAQLVELHRQNSKLAQQQFRVLELQQEMLDRQAERELAVREQQARDDRPGRERPQGAEVPASVGPTPTEGLTNDDTIVGREDGDREYPPGYRMPPAPGGHNPAS